MDEIKTKIKSENSVELTGFEIDCEICGKTLRNEKGLQKHILEVRSRGKSLLELCITTFLPD